MANVLLLDMLSPYQNAFRGMVQPFDLQFPFSGRTAGVVTFQVHHTQRLPAAEVFCSGPIGVLPETPHRIRGNAGIKRVIRAEDYIDMPVHGLSSAPISAVAIFLSGKPDRRRAICAIGRQPVQLGNQFCCQLHAIRVDLETTCKDLAATGDHIQIAAGGLGVDDLAAAILQLFKAASAALIAEVVPLAVIRSIVCHCIFLNPRCRNAEARGMLVLAVVYAVTSLLFRVSSVEQLLCQGKPKHKAFRASEGVKALRIQDFAFKSILTGRFQSWPSSGRQRPRGSLHRKSQRPARRSWPVAGRSVSFLGAAFSRRKQQVEELSRT